MRRNDRPHPPLLPANPHIPPLAPPWPAVADSALEAVRRPMTIKHKDWMTAAAQQAPGGRAKAPLTDVSTTTSGHRQRSCIATREEVKNGGAAIYGAPPVLF